MDQVNSIFKLDYICIEDNIETKDESLKKLALMGLEAKILKNESSVYEELLEREVEFSTGFGDGFAIPHAKSKLIVEPGVFIIKCKNQIEWKAIDNRPVNIIIGLLVPYESRGNVHLSLLAKLSENLMDEEFKLKLQNANSKTQIYDLVYEVLKK